MMYIYIYINRGGRSGFGGGSFKKSICLFFGIHHPLTKNIFKQKIHFSGTQDRYLYFYILIVVCVWNTEFRILGFGLLYPDIYM